MKNAIIQISFVIGLFIFSCREKKEKVDFLFINGTIYSCDSAFNVHSAMAIKNGKVADIGNDEEMIKNYTSDSIIDLKGKMVYPGFHDAHAHFFGLAQSLRNIHLKNTPSWDAVLDTLIKYSKNSKDWILGRGWDQNDWEIPAFPDNKKLDSLFPDRPVFLKRIDGHAAIVNSVALKLAGIHEKIVVSGGEVKKINGKPTGVLIDNAMQPVEKIIPKPEEKELTELLLKAQEICLSHGITAITECGIDYDEAMLIHKLQNEGKIKLSFAVMLSDTKKNLEALWSPLPMNDKFRILGIKAYADGALGSRGACLLQPYSDTKKHTGFLLCTLSHLDSLAKTLAETDMQLCTHAIGDSAVRTVLDIYAKYLQQGNKKYWRIEHAQMVHPSDLSKFKKYGIIPSVQPPHAISDGPWAIERLGEGRIQHAYAYRSLSENSALLPLGTDFPVEDVNPLGTFVAAVFRKDLSGKPEKGYYPDEKLPRKKTISGMTREAALAAKMNAIGSLEKHKPADFIITDFDLLKSPEEDFYRLKKLNIISLFIDGKRINP
jgi:predicted amidohydrolase YtcJ